MEGKKPINGLARSRRQAKETYLPSRLSNSIVLCAGPLGSSPGLATVVVDLTTGESLCFSISFASSVTSVVLAEGLAAAGDGAVAPAGAGCPPPSRPRQPATPSHGR